MTYDGVLEGFLHMGAEWPFFFIVECLVLVSSFFLSYKIESKHNMSYCLYQMLGCIQSIFEWVCLMNYQVNLKPYLFNTAGSPQQYLVPG